MLTLGTDSPMPAGPGRTYSVWSWERLAYDYYHDPHGIADAQGWYSKPPTTNAPPISRIGDPVENCLRELPSGCRYVGTGPSPRGEIAVRHRRSALWKYDRIPSQGGAGIQGLGDDVPSDVANRERGSGLPGAGPSPSLLLWVGGAILMFAALGKLKQAL